MYTGDVGSVYDDDVMSRVGGVSRAPSIISRQSTINVQRDEGLYGTHLLDRNSGM